MKNPTTRYVVFVIVLLVALLASAIFIYHLQKKNADLASRIPPTAAEEQADIDRIVPHLKKFMVLPDERPTIATVIDKSKLANQPFFRNAENQDKILVFEAARKVLLYRPVGTGSGRVINYDVFIINPPANQRGQRPAGQPPANPIKVEVRNGSTTTGAAAAVEKQLKDAAGAAIVTELSNANSRDYKGILVADPSGKNAQAAQQLASFLKGQVGTLPRGEAEVENDAIVIIVGEVEGG